ncbi:sRNA-binding protein [Roseovarius sp. MBR-154]|jgi:hypothetical protein
MRSSKSRSRNKPSRNRSVGNIVNRVFDSSGPEGKVRGTPQQIIEKYNQLARDAQVSGDRVATENFQQHAEHYLRMLGEAQKEQDARREEQERQNRDRQGDRDRDRGERPQGGRDDGQTRDDGDTGGHDTHRQPADPARSVQPDVIDSDSESGLVETPESQDKPAPQKRPRKPRAKKPAKPEGGEDQAQGGEAKDATSGGPAEAAE